MKIKAITLIWLSFLFNIYPVFSQSNLFRYWFYRERLDRKFLHKLKTDIDFDNKCDSTYGGYSLVAREIKIINEPNNTVNSNKNVATWGDAPAYQAFYLGVLATEYELLKRAGLPTAQTLKDLHLAMRAIERLDYRTEHLAYPKINACELNGFFQRDDITDGFSYRFWMDKFGLETVGKDANGWAPNYNSDFLTMYDNIGYYSSKDHHAFLFAGYALIQRFVDVNSYVDSYDNSIKSYNFRQKARDMVTRIMDRYYVGCDKYCIPHTFEASLCTNRQEELSARGSIKDAADLFPYATPFHHAKDNINAGRSISQISPTDLWNSFACCTGGKDDECYRTKDDSNPICGEGVNAYYLNLAAVSDDWYRAVTGWCSGSICIFRGCITFSYPCLKWENRTQQVLSELAQKHQLWTPPLINNVLWGTSMPIDAEFLTALNDMPCDEYHPYAAVSNGNSKWVADNRFEKYWTARTRNYNKDIDNGLQYNGLDYLFLFNLYALKHPSENLYTNLMDRKLSSFWCNGSSSANVYYCAPSLNQFFGIKSVTTDLKLPDLSCSSPGPSSYSLIAGQTIKMTNGFQIKNGKSFSAKIRKIECADGVTATSYCDNAPYTNVLRKAVEEEKEFKTEISPIKPLISNPSPLRLKKEKVYTVSIAPNPAENEINISFSLQEEKNLRLTILNGQGVYLKEIVDVFVVTSEHNNLHYDISDLSAGVYYVKADAADFSKVIKFIKY